MTRLFWRAFQMAAVTTILLALVKASNVTNDEIGAVYKNFSFGNSTEATTPLVSLNDSTKSDKTMATTTNPSSPMRSRGRTPRLLFLSDVRANLNTALTLLTAPQLALQLVINRTLQAMALVAMWYWLHFLFWDYNQTVAAEQFSMTALVRVLSNPTIQFYNILVIWLTALHAHIVFSGVVVLLNNFPALGTALINLEGFFLKLFGVNRPPLIQAGRDQAGAGGAGAAAGQRPGGAGAAGGAGAQRPGAAAVQAAMQAAAQRRPRPRPKRQINPFHIHHPEARIFTTPYTEGDVGLGFRRLLCPLCVARIITFTILSWIGNMLLWSFVTYWRGPNFVPSQLQTGRRRKRSDTPLTEEESLETERILQFAEATLISARAQYEQCLADETEKKLATMMVLT